MIKVYYMHHRFSNSGSEEVAEFIDEKLFKVCEEALEKDAKKNKMTMHFHNDEDHWYTYHYECKECNRKWTRDELNQQFRSRCHGCDATHWPHEPSEEEEELELV